MKMNKTAIKAAVPIIIILIVAAYFRLAYYGFAEFKSDEARDAFIIKNIVEGKEFPLLGPPFSGGSRSGPLYYYLLAIPYFFVRSPLASSLFVGILNVFGIYIVYRIGKDFFSKNIGLIASVLLAVSPYAVIHSRKIWNSDILVPFVALFIYFLLKFINKKDSKYFVYLSIPLAFALQLHPTAIVLVILLAICMLLFRQKVKMKYFLIATIIFALLFSPFIYYEVAHNFEYSKAFIDYKSKIISSGLNNLAWQHLINASSGLGFDFFLGSSSNEFYSQLQGVNNVLILEFLLLLVSLVYIIKKIANKDKLRKSYSVLVFCFLIQMILLGFYSGGIYPHYQNLILPVIFLSIAILLEKIIFVKKNSVKYAATALFVLLVVTQIVFLQTLFNFLVQNGGLPGDYDVAYKYKFDAVNFVANDSGGKDFAASNYFDKNDLNLEYIFFFAQLGKNPSSQANLEYVIINSFTTHLNSTQQNYAASLSKAQFGPMDVYKIQK